MNIKSIDLLLLFLTPQTLQIPKALEVELELELELTVAVAVAV